MTAIIEKKKQQKLAEELVKKTHFNKFEIECLQKKFKQLTKVGNSDKLNRLMFRDILHNSFGMTDDMLMDRVFKCFDQDNDTKINMEEWIRGLSVFLRGTKEEHTKYCFEVYDLNGDGTISREEMFNLLKFCMVKQPADEDADEGTREIVELDLKGLDIDNDHRVSFDDFKQAVERDYLFLESLGPCLPDEKVIREFEAATFSTSQTFL